MRLKHQNRKELKTDNLQTQFKYVMYHKRMLLLSESELILSMNTLSKHELKCTAKIKRCKIKHKNKRLIVPESQILKVNIEGISDQDKKEILIKFNEIGNKYQFTDFKIRPKADKIFVGPQDLSWIFYNFWKFDEEFPDDFSVGKTIFLGLLNLWQRKQLNAKLLSYFKDKMEIITNNLQRDLQNIKKLLKKQIMEPIPHQNSSQSKKHNQNQPPPPSPPSPPSPPPRRTHPPKTSQLIIRSPRTPTPRSCKIQRQSDTTEPKTKQITKRRKKKDPQDPKIIYTTKLQYDNQLADDFCNYINHSLYYSLKTLSTQPNI